MSKMVKVNYKNLMIKEYKEETKVIDILEDFKKYYNYDILVAKLDNEIVELSDPITKSCTIDFFDRSTMVGNEVYARSVQFMLVLAVKRILGATSEITIEHSIDKGIYCEITKGDLDKPILKKIEDEMKNITKEDLIFTKMSVSRIDAMHFYKKRKQMDKVKALKYISNTYINLYRLDNIYDYFYGEMAYSTKAMNDFKLTYIKDNSFVLSYPNVSNPECTLDYKHHNMIFDTFLDYTKWGQLIQISNAAEFI